MATAYIILSILYMLACIADGPDVKPRWKKWLGKRLETISNSLYPIQYVKRPLPEIDNPFFKQQVQVIPADTELIQSNTMFDVRDFLMPAYYFKHEITGIPESQVEFSRMLKHGIENALMEIGKETYRRGLVNLEMRYSHERVILHSEMRIVKPVESMFPQPYVLFEGSKMVIPNPEPFIDTGLISEQQLKF